MAEYSKLQLPFVVVGGLDVRAAPDQLPKGSYSRFSNLEAQLIGQAIMSRRPAQYWPSDLKKFTAGGPVHSIRIVFVPQGRVPPVNTAGIIGAGTNIYDLQNNLLDTGYSGFPLGMAEYRESGNSNPWILVADFNKMTKVQPFTPVGPVQVAKLGISPPGAVPPYIGAGAPAVSVADGGGLLDSSTGVGYDWRYTYYSSITQQAESNPSAIQASLLSVTLKSVDLAPGALSTDPQVDTIRWWRRGGTLGDTWRLIGTQGNVGALTGNIVASPNGIVQGLQVTELSPLGLVESGNIVTVTLAIPMANGVQAGDTVSISGAIVAGYNGDFVITAIISATQFQLYNPTAGLAPSAGFVYFSLLLVTTTAPLAITVGSSVVIAGATNAFYDGTFPVRSVDSPTQFEIYFAGLSLGPGGSGGGTISTVPFNDNNADVAIASAEVLSLTNDVPVTTIDQNNNTVYEQPLPYLWGPYQGNTFFGTGDPNRRGYIYWSNPGNPDGWSSINNVEVTQPTDPLANGFVWDGRIFVFSGEKILEGFPLTIGNILGYQFFDAGAGHGLAASWAFEAGPTSPKIWFWTRSAGIVEWAGGGPAVSITEEKLWPLFRSSSFVPVNTPTENLYPVSSTSGNPRMKFHDQEVRFCYTDTNGNAGNVLVYNIYDRRWRHASYPWSIFCMEGVDEGEDQTFLFGADSIYGESSLFSGKDDALTVGTAQNLALDLKTGYLTEPDYEAMKEYGSVIADYLANSTLLTLTARFADGSGAPVVATISNGATRGQTAVSLAPAGSGEDTYARDIAIEIAGSASANVTLFGLEILYRLDIVPTIHVYSQHSSWGISGYLHVTPDSYLTLRSVANVVVTFYPDTGPNFSITIPSTGGLKQKIGLQAVPANKELLIAVSVDSASPFRLYAEDSFLSLMPWSGQTQPVLAPAFAT